GLLTDLARERARAEARETEAMLRFRDAEMPRTTPQRTADLLAAWCTTNQAGEAAVHDQIAVKLPAAVFTAATDGFAEAADGSWSAPAAWVLNPQLISNPVWHRLIVDPITDDVLAHQYVGRLAPDILRQAADPSLAASCRTSRSPRACGPRTRR
ncbi:MAG: hypothetical protein WCB95_05755, partial [Aeromicrobium sp.]